MILNTNNSNNVLKPITQTVYVNGVYRPDLYCTQVSATTGLVPGNAQFIMTNPEFDSKLFTENDLVKVYLDKTGLIFAGYITEISSNLDNSSRSTTYTAMDYRAKLNDTYSTINYNFIDSTTHNRVNYLSTREMVSNLYQEYSGYIKFTYGATEPVMKLDINSFPDVWPLIDFQIKGTGIGKAIEQILQSIDKDYQLKIEYIENESWLSCFHAYNGIKDGNFLYVDNPEHYVEDNYNVGQCRKTFDYMDPITNFDTEGDNYIIQDALRLEQFWDPSMNNEDTQRIIKNIDRFTKKNFGTYDKFYVEENPQNPRQYQNPDYQWKYTNLFTKFKIQNIDDIWIYYRSGPNGELSGVAGQYNRIIPHEGRTLQLKMPAYFSGSGWFSGDGFFSGHITYFKDYTDNFPIIENVYYPEWTRFTTDSGYLSCFATFSGSGSWTGAQDNAYVEPFIVYQKQTDGKIIDGKYINNNWYAMLSGFSIREQKFVEFNEPFLDNYPFVKGSSADFYCDGFLDGISSCFFSGFLSEDELFHTGDDSWHVVSGDYLVLENLMFYEIVSNAIYDSIGMQFSVKGNLQGCGVDFGDGEKPFRNACIMRHKPLLYSGITGVGNNNVYTISTTTDIFDENRELFSKTLLTSKIAMDGTVSPRYDATLKSWDNIYDNDKRSITFTKEKNLTVDAGQYWLIPDDRIVERIPFLNPKLNIAYRSLRTLKVWGQDTNTCAIKRNVVYENKDFKYEMMKSGSFWWPNDGIESWNTFTEQTSNVLTIDKVIRDDTNLLTTWGIRENAGKQNPKFTCNFDLPYMDMQYKIGDIVILNGIDTKTTVVGIRYQLGPEFITSVDCISRN